MDYKDNDKAIPLRAHHGMCFQFFEGKGYDDSFTGHMGKVIRFFELYPESRIKIVNHTDIVCQNCPNNNVNICESFDKVKRYDNEVLCICNLKDGEELSYQAFISIVKEKIINTNRRGDICGDCQWDFICGKKSK